MNRLQKLLSIEGYDGINEVVLESPCFELDQDGEVFSHVFLGMTKDELLIGVQTIPDYHNLSDIVLKPDVDLEIDGLVLKTSIPLEWLRFYVVDDRSRKFAICSCIGSIRYFELCNTPDGSDELWLKWLDFISQQDDPKSFGFKSWYFYDNHRVEKCHLEFIKRPYPFYCVETIGSQTSDTLLDQPDPSIHALNLKLSSGKVSRQVLSTKSSLRQLSNQSVCAKLSAEQIINHPLPCFKNSKHDLVSIRSKYNIEERLAYNEWLTADQGRDLKRSGSCSTIVESSPFSPTIRKYSVFSLIYQACNGDKDKAIEQISGYFPHKDNSDEIFKIYAQILWHQSRVSNQSNERCSLECEPSISELMSGNNLTDLALDKSANLSPQKLSFLKRKLMKTRAGLSKLENVVNTVVLENVATLKKPMPFTQFTPPEFSREMMLMVSEKIVKITQIDFQKLQFKVMPASVKILLDNYHAISEIISDDIISSDDLPRDKLIVFYIKVADYCFNHGYLQCCEAVIVGICSPIVYSNIEDWIAVTENSPKEFKLLVKMINIMFDARNYLEHLRVHIEKRNLRLPIHDHFLLHVWGARPDMDRFKEHEKPQLPEIDIVKKESGSKLKLWITRSFSSNTKLKTNNSKSLLKRAKSDIHSRGWNTERVGKEHLKNSKSAHEIKALKTDSNGDVCISDSKTRKSKLKKSKSNISRKSSTHVVHETESSQYIELTDEQILDIQTKMAHKFCEQIIAESLEILRNEPRSDISLSSSNKTSICEHPNLSHQSIEHLRTATPDRHKQSYESVENQQQQQNTRSQESLQKHARSMEHQLQHRTQSYEHSQKRIQSQEQQPQGIRSYEQQQHRIKSLEQEQRRAHSLDILSGYSQTGESDVKPVSSKNVSSSKQNAEKARKEKKKGCLLWKRSKEKTSDHSLPPEIETQYRSIDSEELQAGLIQSQEQQPQSIGSYEQHRMQSLEQQPQATQSYKQPEYCTESNEEQQQAIEPYKQQPQLIHSLEQQQHDLRARERQPETTQSHEQKQYRIPSQQQPSVQSHKNLQQRAHSLGHIQRTRFDAQEQRRAHSLDILSGYSQTGESDVKPVSSKNVLSSKQNAEKAREEKKKGVLLWKRSKEKASAHSPPLEIESQYRSIDSEELQEGLIQSKEQQPQGIRSYEQQHHTQSLEQQPKATQSYKQPEYRTESNEEQLQAIEAYKQQPQIIHSLEQQQHSLRACEQQPEATQSHEQKQYRIQSQQQPSVQSHKNLQQRAHSFGQIQHTRFDEQKQRRAHSLDILSGYSQTGESDVKPVSPKNASSSKQNAEKESKEKKKGFLPWKRSKEKTSGHSLPSEIESKYRSIDSEELQEGLIEPEEIVYSESIPAKNYNKFEKQKSHIIDLGSADHQNQETQTSEHLLKNFPLYNSLNPYADTQLYTPVLTKTYLRNHPELSQEKITSSVHSKEHLQSPSPSTERLKQLSFSRESINQTPSNESQSIRNQASSQSKDEFIKFAKSFASSNNRIGSPLPSKEQLNNLVNNSVGGIQDRVSNSVESQCGVDSPLYSKDHLKTSVSSQGHQNSFVTSAEINIPVVSKDRINSPVASHDRLTRHVSSTERASSHVPPEEQVNSSMSFKDRLISLITSKDRVNSPVASKDHVPPEDQENISVWSGPHVNIPVVSTDQINSPAQSIDHLNSNVPSKRDVNSPKGSKTNLENPVSSQVMFNSSVSSKGRINSPISSKDRINSPVASTDCIKGSVASAHYVDSFVKSSPISSADRVDRYVVSAERVTSPVSSTDSVNRPAVSDERVRSRVSSTNPVNRSVVSAERVRSPEASAIRVNSPVASNNRVNSLIDSEDRVNGPLYSTVLINSPSKNHVNNPVASKDDVINPLLSSDHLNSSISLKDRLRSLVTGTSKDQIKSHSSSKNRFTSTDRVDSPVASKNRLSSPVMSSGLVNSPSSSIDRVNSPVPSQDHFDSPVESNDRVNSPVVSKNRLRSPVMSAGLVNSPSSSIYRVDSPVPSQDHFVSPVESNDRVNSPVVSKNRLRSPVMSADLVNSPLSSIDRVNSRVQSQDHFDSPVESNDRLNSPVVSKKLLNSVVASEDRIKCPVASQDFVNSPDLNSSISLKDRLKCFVTGTSKDQIISHSSSKNRSNSPFTSTDRVDSPVASKNRLSSPVMSAGLVNSPLSSIDRVNSRVQSQDHFDSPVESNDHVNSPVVSQNRLRSPVMSADVVNSRFSSIDRVYSPVLSQDHFDNPVESNDRVNSPVVSKNRLRSPVMSADQVNSPSSSIYRVDSPVPSQDHFDSPVESKKLLNSVVASEDRIKCHVASQDFVNSPDLNSSISLKDRLKCFVTGTSKDQINSSLPKRNRLNSTVTSADRVHSPVASQKNVNSPVESKNRVNSPVVSKNLVNSHVASEDSVNSPVASKDRVNIPVASENLVNSHVMSNNRVNSPLESKNRVNSPVASEDRVNSPVMSKNLVSSHIASEDSVNGPVPSQDHFYSPVVSKDRLKNPSLSSYLNSFVSLKDRVNSPLTSTDGLHTVVKSTVRLDNPVPSLNQLVNNSDLSEDRLNSTDDPLNSSKDLVNSPVPSQDHFDSPVDSHDRLVVSKKSLNSHVASDDSVKSPVASKDFVNHPGSLSNHLNSSISLKDRLKSFVTGTSKDKINSALPMRNPLNSTVTSADRVNSPVASQNHVNSPVASEDRANSPVASKDRVNSPVVSKNPVNSYVASVDRVNGPVPSQDRFDTHVVSNDRKESPVPSQDRFYSPVVSKDLINNPALSKPSYLNSFISLKDRVNSPLTSTDGLHTVVKSTVGLDNPVPSLNQLVNNSDFSEGRLNSTDDPLNSSNDRLYSSQDDVKSSVLSKGRLSDDPLINQSNEQLFFNSPGQSYDSLGKNSAEVVSKKMKKKKKGLFFRRNSKHKDSMEIIEPTTEPLQTDSNVTSPVIEGALLENLDMQVNPIQPLPVLCHQPGSATTFEADAHDTERKDMYDNSAYDITMNDSPMKSASGNRTSNGNFDPDDTQYFTTRHKQNLELLKTMSVFATASNDIINQQKEDAIKNAIEANLENYKKSSIFDEIYLDEVEDEKPVSNLKHRTSSLTKFLSGSNDVIGRANDIGGSLKRTSSLLSSLFSKNDEENDRPEDSVEKQGVVASQLSQLQHPENTSGKNLGFDRLPDTSIYQNEDRDEQDEFMACALDCDSEQVKDDKKDNRCIKENWIDSRSSVMTPYVPTSKEMCRFENQTMDTLNPKPRMTSSSKELTGILKSSKDNIFRNEDLPSWDRDNFSSMATPQDSSKAEDQIEELPSAATVSKDPNSENSSENVQHKHANLQSYLSEFENIHHKAKTSFTEMDVEKVMRSSAKRKRRPSDESEPADVAKNHQMNFEHPKRKIQCSGSKGSLKKGTTGKGKFSVFNFLENLLFHDGESSVFKELFVGTDESDSDSEDAIDIPSPADEEMSIHAKKDGSQTKHVHFGDVSEIEYEDLWSDVEDQVDENFNSSSKPPKPICDKCQGPCIFSPDLFQELLRSQLLAITFINSHTSRILLRNLINDRIDICEQRNKA